MNYSIILLGATISVSLFIRICGVCSALETTLKKHNDLEDYPWGFLKEHNNNIAYGWLIDDPLYHFKSEMKKIFHESGESPQSKQGIDLLIDQMASDLQYPYKILDGKSGVIQSSNNNTKDWEHLDFFPYQLCGDKYNRNDTEWEGHCDILKEGDELPEGCIYEDEPYNTKLSCEQVSKMPPLPEILTNFDLKYAYFDTVDGSEFQRNVSIANIRFYQNYISTIVPWAFEKIKNLKSLQIIHNKLTYLAYDLYVGLVDVQTLLLDGNLISLEIYLGCKPQLEYSIVLPNLKYFSLKGNPLKIVPCQMWAGLRESPLNTLVLSSCSLEYICPDSFTYMPNLLTLYLDENPKLMTNLTIAFEGLRNGKLETLTLAENQLTEIQSEALSLISQSLTTLDLSGNPFRYINPGSFPKEGMKKLMALNLSNCKLQSISLELANIFPNLVTLDLRNNLLTEIPPPVLMLSRLRSLNLDSNAGKKDVGDTDPKFIIPPHSLSNLTSLTFLFINKTPIKRIEKNTFAGMSNLTFLVMNDAKINKIEDLAFRDLTSLQTLQLENNTISSIDSFTFYGLTNLQHLFLTNCGLSFPIPESGYNFSDVKSGSTKANPYRPFVHLENLRTLDIQNNIIDNIYPELFNGLHKLRTLDLSRNKIKSWETQIFTSNYSITRGQSSATRTVKMNKNQLGFITDAMIQDIINFRPDVVDLSENPFLCNEGSCRLRDLMMKPSNDSNEESMMAPIIWGNITDYLCTHTILQKNYLIPYVTDEICKSDKAIDDGVTVNSPQSSSGKIVIIIVGIVCGTCFLVGTLLVGYKKRVHLKYMWFSVKLNILEIPRKAKTSIEESVHDYDLFISYHNKDRDFIIDEFLPEIEEESSDFPRDEENPQHKGFRVCLHERDFEVGMGISENIVESVDRSKKVVIVVSRKYLESQWCTYEMNLTYHRLIEARRTSYLLVLLEDIPAELRTKVLNYMMKSRTYLEWPGALALPHEKRRFWARLKTGLSSSD